MNRVLLIAALVVISACGRSDPTYEHRKALAISISKAIAWQHPDIESIPADRQQLHLGMGRARAMANALETCLESSPPFSKELLTLILSHARSSRTVERQYRSAIDDGRSDLNQNEQKTSQQCNKDQHVLLAAILERVYLNDLVAEVSEFDP